MIQCISFALLNGYKREKTLFTAIGNRSMKTLYNNFKGLDKALKIFNSSLTGGKSGEGALRRWNRPGPGSFAQLYLK